jgi:hypothetical protein
MQLNQQIYKDLETFNCKLKRLHHLLVLLSLISFKLRQQYNDVVGLLDVCQRWSNRRQAQTVISPRRSTWSCTTDHMCYLPAGAVTKAENAPKEGIQIKSCSRSRIDPNLLNLD